MKPNNYNNNNNIQQEIIIFFQVFVQLELEVKQMKIKVNK
jgi:hypothetical protein